MNINSTINLLTRFGGLCMNMTFGSQFGGVRGSLDSMTPQRRENQGEESRECMDAR